MLDVLTHIKCPEEKHLITLFVLALSNDMFVGFFMGRPHILSTFTSNGEEIEPDSDSHELLHDIYDG